MGDLLSDSGAMAPLLVPGMRLGKYQLLKRLAVGGMAEIYLARASGIEGFEKYCVLKRILPQHASNDEFIKMFLDEARLAATLHHPNIAQTYDIGVEGGSYFFTMEYVHGEDMRQILKTCARAKKGLPLDHSISMILGTAAGLHNAHEKVGADGRPLSIVHRDVSPSNVIVTYDGAVKVVDFGIAKAATHRAESRVGSLKGKIAYMSPEQCKGEKLDRRSDVFAIGILLYELTTGTRLFKGENEFAILTQIVQEDVPKPSTRRPGYPEALERIVVKALKRNRDDRYGSAQELQIDLENFAREQRLVVSSVALQSFMVELFGKKVEPWRDVVVSALSDQPPSREATSDPIMPKPSQLDPRNSTRVATPGARDRSASGISHILAGESAVTPMPKNRRSLMGAAVGLAVAGAIVAAALIVRGGRKDGEQRPAAPIAAPAPVTTPTAVAPQPVPEPVPEPVPAPIPTTTAPVAPTTLAVTPPVTRPKTSKSSKSRPTSKPTTKPVTKPVSKPKPGWDPDSPLPP